MDKTRLSGIMPALMASFNDDGIDTRKVAELVKKQKADGVDGLYVGGSSAEMILCTEKERMTLLETAIEAADGLAVIAHVGSMSTRDTVTLSAHAKKCGADAVSSVTPLYFKYGFAEVKHYYERIAEASELPVIIYNIPGLTGTAYGYDQLCELLEIEGVCGMKFTLSDFFLLNMLVQTYPDKVFYNGCDEMLLSGLAAGADGGIGTTYNFMPDIITAVYKAYKAGDIKNAQQTQELANRVIAVILKYGAVPGCKAMIEYYGIPYGDCREPFLPLDAAAKSDLYENAHKLIEAWRSK